MNEFLMQLLKELEKIYIDQMYVQLVWGYLSKLGQKND